MEYLLVEPASHVQGKIHLLGDKSIAHRSIIISAIALGKTTIENFPLSKDCLYTIEAFRQLGIKIRKDASTKTSATFTVFGKGLYGLKAPSQPIFLGDSGTTFRLLLGLLAGQNFKVKLTTGKSLSQRPMLRVSWPLRMMGAEISAKCKAKSVKRIEEYPPITIRGGNLKPITYKMPVASAQVKSAILLAGLYTSGLTQIIEPIKTRDHTERMLKQFKAEIKVKGPAFVKAPAGCPPKRSKGGPNKIVIKGNQLLVAPKNIYIPGDISSASFFLVLASILPNSQIWLRKVSLNPSRAGIIKVLKRMGADIRVTSYELRVTSYEPMGDIRVSSSKLKGTIVKKAEIPSLIDELPILMVAACFAKGKTVFNGVEELRVKETDRIRSMSENLRKMGADIEIYQTAQSEKIIIHGGKRLQGAKVKSFRDHRTALSMIIAGLAAEGKTLIDDISCINKSFPDFLSLLKPLLR